MKCLTIPIEAGYRRLPFYLATEEWAARHVQEEDLFLMWQVKPTVIFGRNQSVGSEVNVSYCRANNIEMYRRKSGGGCVYADEGNIMLSYITREENTSLAFYTFINMVILMLRRLGIEAVATNHNDVLIGDRKVSGAACYRLPGANIVHSTLLFDTNMQHMTHAITPGQEKLQKKGIQSVRQRITLLKDYTTLSLDEVKAQIRQTLCDGGLMLDMADVAEIERIEQSYLKEEFINLLT